jgi:hypothetical protein
MDEKLAHIFSLIDQYINGQVDITGLEQNIEIHFSDFDSIEERHIYNALRNLGAYIELTRFTVDDDKQLQEIKKHVETFKSRISLK